MRSLFFKTIFFTTIALTSSSIRDAMAANGFGKTPPLMFSIVKKVCVVFTSALTLNIYAANAMIVPLDPWSKEEFEYLKSTAANGDVGAEFSLALFYYKPLHPSAFYQQEVAGLNIQKDNKKALAFFQQVAASGNLYYGPKAQTYIGFFYDRGIVVDQDYMQALKWYQKAAVQNYPRAEDLIGRMYRDGHGVTQSYLIASQFFEKAANQHTISNVHLAHLYSSGGPEFSKDYERALFWITLSKYRRNDGLDDLCCEDGDFSTSYYNEVKTHLTQQQIQAIQKQGMDYKFPVSQWGADPAHL